MEMTTAIAERHAFEPFRGQLGWWDVPDEIVQRVKARLEAGS